MPVVMLLALQPSRLLNLFRCSAQRS